VEERKKGRRNLGRRGEIGGNVKSEESDIIRVVCINALDLSPLNKKPGYVPVGL